MSKKLSEELVELSQRVGDLEEWCNKLAHKLEEIAPEMSRHPDSPKLGPWPELLETLELADEALDHAVDALGDPNCPQDLSQYTNAIYEANEMVCAALVRLKQRVEGKLK